MLKLENLIQRLTQGTEDKDYADLIEMIKNSTFSNKTQKITVTNIFQVVETLREKLLVRAHGNSLLKGLDQPRAAEVY